MEAVESMQCEACPAPPPSHSISQTPHPSHCHSHSHFHSGCSTASHVSQRLTAYQSHCRVAHSFASRAMSLSSPRGHPLPPPWPPCHRPNSAAASEASQAERAELSTCGAQATATQRPSYTLSARCPPARLHTRQWLSRCSLASHSAASLSVTSLLPDTARRICCGESMLASACWPFR